MDEISVDSKQKWIGDVLVRKPYADFLTSYLVSKVKGKDKNEMKSFTLALDAQWGQGKTFFVTNWARDLAESTPAYPTLVFDAWSADYAADPLIAFMAAFKSALDQKIEETGLSHKLKKEVTEQVASAVNGFRRAILPAGKQIVKGLLQKATGIATDEIFDAYIKGADLPNTVDREMLSKAGLDTINKGLDEFFTKALEEQVERQKSISEFRVAIENTLKNLAQHKAVTLPMFVFIDEVDRCRPSFAIALLEGVKHLFGVPGVCFIVSTNMSQLSESIRAIYGSGFDGYGYLKRFFDVEYSLPLVSGSNFIKLLLAEHPELENYRLALGLPYKGFGLLGEETTACNTLSWVAEVFDLDLRSQRKVFEMVLAAAAGIPQDKKVFLLWLSVLCAIRHKNPIVFEALANSRENAQEFTELWGKIVSTDLNKIFHLPRSVGGGDLSRPVQLKDVVQSYYANMYRDLKDIRHSQSEVNYYDYPASVILELAEEMPNTYYEGRSYPPSISTYFHLVRTAGHLVAF